MQAYVSKAEAEAYFAQRIDSEAWEKADDITREAALVTATRRIDMQRLRRKWTGPDNAPQAVKDACCEEALFMLAMSADDKVTQRKQTLGIVGASVGDANEYAQQSVVQARAQGAQRLLSPDARALLAPYKAGVATIV